jgi:ribosome biogenesis protein BRX1
MASVYKTVSKKQSRQQAEESEPDDVEMEDMLADADDTSESEEEEEEEEAEDSSKKQQLSSGFMPKSRVLMLTSRGVTHRYVLFERRREPIRSLTFGHTAIDTCSRTSLACSLMPTKRPN